MSMHAVTRLFSRTQPEPEPNAKRLPADKLPDSTLALALEGYRFIANRCNKLGADAFMTRILFEPTICMRGKEAAKIFYDPEKFQRKGAAPLRLQATLFGRGGVQSLDGERHRARKQMFLSIVSPERVAALVALGREEWRRAAARWVKLEKNTLPGDVGGLVLFDEAREISFRAVCRWCALPFEDSEVSVRTAQMASLIDSGGRVGPRHWRGRLDRRRAETWAAEWIRKLRSGEVSAPEDSALRVIAMQREVDGKLLSPKRAAVELLNVIRPTVAVARFIVFGALALHEHPEWRAKIAKSAEAREMFVQEVRRFYPFFPGAVARVRRTFTWRGYEFPAKTRTMLDLYATNHDPRSFREPDEFRPERFREWNESAFNFIPQGGGDFQNGHRCPGERITIELMKDALEFLVTEVSYEVPVQNLEVRLSRMPALPESGFVIRNVQRGQR